MFQVYINSIIKEFDFSLLFKNRGFFQYLNEFTFIQKYDMIYVATTLDSIHSVNTFFFSLKQCFRSDSFFVESVFFFSVYEFYIQVGVPVEMSLTELLSNWIKFGTLLCCRSGDQFPNCLPERMKKGPASWTFVISDWTSSSYQMFRCGTSFVHCSHQGFVSNVGNKLPAKFIYRLDIFLCFDIFSIVICGRNKSDSGCSGLKTCGYLLWMQFQILHRHQG